MRDGGPGDDRDPQLAVDAAGDIYIAGTLTGQIAFGAVNLVAHGAADVDAATGATRWSNVYSTTGDDRAFALTYGRTGDAYASSASPDRSTSASRSSARPAPPASSCASRPEPALQPGDEDVCQARRPERAHR